MKPCNILIDTDLGDDVDDVLALAFALLRPELNVCAITTVSYATDLRCHLLRSLLRAMNREDVPFAPGMKWPLRPISERERANSLAPEGYILNQCCAARDEDKFAPPEHDAIELIARKVDEFAGDITLVAIGPLTNFAVALCRFPEIAPKIKSIALMGGETQLNRREHNVAWDSNAARIVFEAGIHLFVGTWDVTRRFVLTSEDCEKIKNHDAPLHRFMSECIEAWWPHKAHKPSPVMYDVAPILWSYAPEFFETEAAQIRVETGGEHTSGMTTRGWGEPNALVTTNMDAERVRALYLETLGLLD